MTLRRLLVASGADLEGFRRAARTLVAEGIGPEAVLFSPADEPTLFGTGPGADAPALRIPRPAADLIEAVVPHRDPERYGLLYALVWRVLHGERALLENASDPLVHRLEGLRRAVRRDVHRMHAFLRFRAAADPDGERFVAWFEPDHFILEAAAPFFVERFGAMRWSILTPIGSAHWDRSSLAFGPAARREDAPEGDGFEAGWRAYYESTFNPARTNPRLMRTHMPQRYWGNMPEATAIRDLVRTAPDRVTEMIEREATVPRKRSPDRALAAMREDAPHSLAELNAIIRSSSPLVPGATQAVLGEGPEGAPVALVGEQPGDQEDVQGRPFVGPAGQLLTRALADAGLERREVYVTNAVKHFKFEQRGKRRIHSKPTAGEVSHYRWWLEKELEFVAPRIVVALGATAVLALTGKALPITRSRGPAEFGARFQGYITVHPSYLLRLPDAAAKEEGFRAFVADLDRVRQMAEVAPALASS